MITRLVLCTAMMLPSGSAPLVPTAVLPDQGMVLEECPVMFLDNTQGQCLYEFECCLTGMFFAAEGPCDLILEGCPCDETVSTMRMPAIQGRPAAVRASAREQFAGVSMSDVSTMFTSNENITRIYSDIVEVSGKPYWAVSIISSYSGQRYDLGYELNTDTAGVENFQRGELIAQVGTDLQVRLRTDDGARVFHLVGKGTSAVQPRRDNEPLIPIPDPGPNGSL